MSRIVARKGKKKSNYSAVFICVSQKKFLTGFWVIFSKIISGFSVLHVVTTERRTHALALFYLINASRGAYRKK